MLNCSGSQSGGSGPGVPSPSTSRYLALGDSYTIGEGVADRERWPVQLVAMLRARGVRVSDPEIIARTGWTTDELDRAIDAAKPTGPYSLVTLLIGVNNQFRGRSAEEYREGFRLLLQRAIQFAGNDPRRVIVLSIPDWGVTPAGEGKDREKIAAEIDQFNAINRAETVAASARYIDITAISRKAGSDSSLIAPDGLHPSGAMYEEWARQTLPDALEVLGGN